MNLAKYWQIAKSEFHHELSDSGNSFVGIAILVVVLFVFLQIWKTVYGQETTIEGFTIAQMIWYLAVAEIITFSNASHKVEDINEEVRTGLFSLSLLKPINYAYRWLANLFGYGSFVLLFFGSMGLVLAWLFVGTIPFTFSYIPFILIAVLGALFMNFLFVLIYGLLSFWFEETESLSWIHTKFTFIMGGMFMPYEVYPAWIQPILHKLPFSYMMYGPAKLFVKFSFADFVH
ncbi:MAG: ABC-2 family transporter protein, partial [Candidatus Woesearchaeota archaeon]|nr:ABC-2 family transporter protein [Candidatus Woesearchaeota archaeon]